MKLFLSSLLFVWGSLCISNAGNGDIYSVKDFGAVGNKQHKEQQSIQAAIDKCHEDGGGIVFFPAGDYLSGSIHLRSRVTLHLSAGATLWASTHPADYDPGSRGRLLAADHADHLAIVGQGTIHGQGVEDYGSRWGKPDKPGFRTGILLFEQCKNISIRDVTILYSDSWTLHFKRCENVTVDGVTIHNNIRRLNSDGIDPNSCRNVHISNCHIVAGDDCIVLKATEPYPCENVVVTNCTLETTTTALKLGTESKGNFRDIHVSNCTIKNSRGGIGFFMKDGTVMERVTFSHISIETFRQHPYQMDIYPIFMDIEKRHADSPVGKIRDVLFRDIMIHSGSGILIQGMPQSAIENLTLKDIILRVDWLDDISNRKKAVGGHRTYRDDRDRKFAQLPSFVTLANVENITLDNILVDLTTPEILQNDRSAVYAWNVKGGDFSNIQRRGKAALQTAPVVRLHDCQDILVRNNRAVPGINTFLQVSGTRSRNLSLSSNDFTHAQRGYSLLDAPPKALRIMEK